MYYRTLRMYPMATSDIRRYPVARAIFIHIWSRSSFPRMTLLAVIGKTNPNHTMSPICRPGIVGITATRQANAMVIRILATNSVSISFRIPFIISCSWALVRDALWWIFIQVLPKRGQNHNDPTANCAILRTMIAIQLSVMVIIIENKKHHHHKKTSPVCKRMFL